MASGLNADDFGPGGSEMVLHDQHGNNLGFEDGGGVLALGGLGLGGFLLFTLASFSIPLSVAVGVYTVWTIILMVAAEETRAPGWIRFLLGLSIAAAITLAPVVFVIHAAPYELMTWGAVALYVLALLFFGGALDAVTTIIAWLVAAAMATALFMLPAPDGAADPDDDSKKWRVIVTVLDENAEPLENAQALCASLLVWEQDWDFAVQPELFQSTDENGIATFEFSADTRLKTAHCAAYLSSREVGEDDYAPRTAMVANPFRGGTFQVTIQLMDRVPAGTGLGGHQTPNVERTRPASANSTPSREPRPAAAAYDLSQLPTAVADAARRARTVRAIAEDRRLTAIGVSATADLRSREAREAAARADEYARVARPNGGATHAYTSNSGYTYRGQWVNGTRNGYGIAIYPNGSRYAGQWRNGERQGLGVLTFRSSSHVRDYAGEYANGDRSGHGVYRWRNGHSYSGRFAHDDMHGLGVYRAPNDHEYSGDYADDRRNGTARVSLPDGNAFYGRFANGNRDGYGVYTWAEGARYEGRWVNDERDGYGVYWNDDGRATRVGTWVGGEFAGEVE